MQPTKKLIALAGLGIVIIGLSILINLHVLMFFLYNFIIILFLLIDFKVTNNKFDITRVCDLQMSLFAEEKMGFKVYNKSPYELKIRIKDTVPDFHFNIIDEYAQGVIKPHEQQIISYRLEPKKRGFYEFTDIYVAYLSRFKLFYKHAVYEMKVNIKVYPNLKDLTRYRLMVYGGYISRGGKRVFNKRGEGLEFESLREYVDADEYRKINWQATAKMNKPIVNQYEVEKNQDVIALIDSGRAMSYEVRGYKKLDLAINTALILSDIANLTGDKSGLMVFNTEILQYIKPSSGSIHRNKLLEALYTIQYSRDTSNFGAAFTYLRQQQKKRSIIFMFTEFETMDEASEYLHVLPQISRRHLVILFMMTKEKVLQLTESTKTEDEELFLKGAAFEVLDERKKIIKSLRRSGIMCVECLPDTLTTEVINHYIQLKHRNYH